MPNPKRSLVTSLGPVRLASEFGRTARGTGAEVRAALAALPRRVTVAVVAILLTVLVPSALSVMEFVGALEGAPLLRALATNAGITWAVVCVLVVGVVVVAEPPRSGSPMEYAKQLRASGERLREQYLAALGGEETTQDNG